MSRRRRRRPYPAEFPDASPRSSRPRGSTAGWLLLGLVIGLAFALFYAWVLNPVVYTDATPARLSEIYRKEYILLVSRSYASNQDWAQAESRLARLEDPNLPVTVRSLLDAEVRAQSDPELIRQLATLAQQLGVEGQAVAIFAPTLPPDNLLPTPTVALALQETAVSLTPTEPITATATPTLLPTPSATPPPTRAATATPQPNYRLLNQEQICADEDVSRIEVVTVDAFLNDLPGVEVLVTTQDESSHFFTGFKPELGVGYGDFSMSAGDSYSVVLAEGSPEVSGLRIEDCDNGTAGGWRLTFQNLLFGATATPEAEETP